MLNPHLHSPQASQKCRLPAQSSAKQNTLLSQHKAIKLSAICTQFKSWLNWTLTSHSIPLEQFGRWDYGYRSTATLQTADAVQVSQPTAITANHLQTQRTEKKTPADSRLVTEIYLPGYAVSSLNTTLHHDYNNLVHLKFTYKVSPGWLKLVRKPQFKFLMMRVES